MVEIAISLAIIGIALVAIIGVLPMGMQIQRANREQTVINQTPPFSWTPSAAARAAWTI